REVASEGTNGLQGGTARTNGLARPSRFAGAGTGQSNQLASARGQRTGQNAVGRDGGTNSMDMAASGQNGNRRMQEAQNNSQAGQHGEGSQADSQGNSQQRIKVSKRKMANKASAARATSNKPKRKIVKGIKVSRVAREISRRRIILRRTKILQAGTM